MMSTLKAVGWLHGLTGNVLSQIEKSGIIRHYDEQSLLFEKDEAMTHYYYVVDGLIQIYHQNKEGKTWIVSLFSQGDLFPHTGLVDDQAVYPANARTIVASTILKIDRRQMRRLIDQYPLLKQWITQFVADKNYELISRLSDRVLEPALIQLISVLKRQALQNGVTASRGWTFIPNLMSEQDLAAYIGVTPETVSRLLCHLYQSHAAKQGGRGKLYINFDRLPT